MVELRKRHPSRRGPWVLTNEYLDEQIADYEKSQYEITSIDFRSALEESFDEGRLYGNAENRDSLTLSPAAHFNEFFKGKFRSSVHHMITKIKNHLTEIGK